MKFHDLQNLIPKIQDSKLPGLQAQLQMAPPGRSQVLRQTDKPPKKAAVICLLYPDENKITHFCLIKRAAYPGVHSDQVGFPGGQLDKSDKSLWVAALRELHEELGIFPADVSQVKTLSPLYIPPSNFWVQPFLGICKITPLWIPDTKEVSEVIEVPLHDFIHSIVAVSSAIHTSKGLLQNVPVYPLRGFEVWGATAMMMAEIQALFKRV